MSERPERLEEQPLQPSTDEESGVLCKVKGACAKRVPLWSLVCAIFSIIALLLVLIAVSSVRISHIEKIDELENRINKIENQDRHDSGYKGQVSVGSVRYELENPTLREVKNIYLDQPTYILAGFKKVRQNGVVPVSINQAGVFHVQSNATYTITAKVAVEDEVKLVAVGLFINDEACDKTVKPVAKIEDPETGKYYKTKITVIVQCLMRDLKKGDEITLRFYHPYNITKGGSPESDAENWLQISHKPI